MPGGLNLNQVGGNQYIGATSRESNQSRIGDDVSNTSSAPSVWTQAKPQTAPTENKSSSFSLERWFNSISGDLYAKAVAAREQDEKLNYFIEGAQSWGQPITDKTIRRGVDGFVHED
jgi:hypothetical protein